MDQVPPALRLFSEACINITANTEKFATAIRLATNATERFSAHANQRAAETEIVRIVRQRQKKDQFRGIQRRRWR